MFLYIFLLFSLPVAIYSEEQNSNFIIELTDEKWDQIQKGQWLIGFFDKETEDSEKLEKYWNDFASKLHENINVARIFAPQNPGLYVRFLVTTFPKVFYIKNGVAHEIQKVNRDIVIEFIKENKWDKLKAVGFLSNPFSIQMSLLSNLFIHAVNLYNFENSIVQKFVSAPSATDFAFGLTFIIVGTTLGLFLTCAFGLIQVLLSEPKESEEREIDKDRKSGDENKVIEKEDDSSEDKSNVRKRK